MQSERNAPKNGESEVGFPFTTMLQHTDRVWVNDFLAKNNVTTLEHSPHLAAAEFKLFPD